MMLSLVFWQVIVYVAPVRDRSEHKRVEMVFPDARLRATEVMTSRAADV
jgi:hypothetical protein